MGDGGRPALGVLRGVAHDHLVLALAANTSFGGLPVLTSLLARDNYLPHLFALRGDRQVFSNGIWVLAVSRPGCCRGRRHTNTLIPLFAIGVFTGFTLSQSGLVVHWWRTRPPRWRPPGGRQRAWAPSSTGDCATVIFLFTKFTEGAWVVVVAVPAFIVSSSADPRLLRPRRLALGLGLCPPSPTASAPS